MAEPLKLALLVPVGVAVGLVGSLIGVGGGFFVVPFLLLVWGGFTKDSATAASLGIVLLSALSATWANGRRKRIDYRTGLVLAAGVVPGAWLGRVGVGRLTARQFAFAFAGLLFLVAAYVAFVRLRPGRGLVPGRPRSLVDGEGKEHRYEANAVLGFAASAGVGVISSLFGVGGGLILVPFLVVAFGMPTLLATAEAQFVFVFGGAAGLAAAVGSGQMAPEGWRVVGAMGLGVVTGAQVGVAIAKRIRERLIRAMIAAVIAAVAVTMVLNA